MHRGRGTLDTMRLTCTDAVHGGVERRYPSMARLTARNRDGVVVNHEISGDGSASASTLPQATRIN
jgi:hypothetical protein